jgi:hypothetical protein
VELSWSRRRRLEAGRPRRRGQCEGSPPPSTLCPDRGLAAVGRRTFHVKPGRGRVRELRRGPAGGQSGLRRRRGRPLECFCHGRGFGNGGCSGSGTEDLGGAPVVSTPATRGGAAAPAGWARGLAVPIDASSRSWARSAGRTPGAVATKPARPAIGTEGDGVKPPLEVVGARVAASSRSWARSVGKRPVRVATVTARPAIGTEGDGVKPPLEVVAARVAASSRWRARSVGRGPVRVATTAAQPATGTKPGWVKRPLEVLAAPSTLCRDRGCGPSSAGSRLRCPAPDGGGTLEARGGRTPPRPARGARGPGCRTAGRPGRGCFT